MFWSNVRKMKPVSEKSDHSFPSAPTPKHCHSFLNHNKTLQNYLVLSPALNSWKLRHVLTSLLRSASLAGLCHPPGPTPATTLGKGDSSSLSLQAECLVAQSCLTLFDPLDCSPPGSSVHGNLQARILQWIATPFPRGSSQSRSRTWVSCLAGWSFTIWTPREATGGAVIDSSYCNPLTISFSFNFPLTCWANMQLVRLNPDVFGYKEQKQPDSSFSEENSNYFRSQSRGPAGFRVGWPSSSVPSSETRVPSPSPLCVPSLSPSALILSANWNQDGSFLSATPLPRGKIQARFSLA